MPVQYELPFSSTTWVFSDLIMTMDGREHVAFQAALVNPSELNTGAVLTNYVRPASKKAIALPSEPEDVGYSEGAKRILGTTNAGGSSELSEAFSFELIHRPCAAQLVKTETEITYWDSVHGWHSKITDFAVAVGSEGLGVSVTRAFNFGMRSRLPPLKQATRLLTKKLQGILASSHNVVNVAWNRQILHILAENEATACALAESYKTLPAELKSNTIVLVTICNNMPWIFNNNRSLALA